MSALLQHDVWSHILSFTPNKKHLLFLFYSHLPKETRLLVQRHKNAWIRLLLPLPSTFVTLPHVRRLHTFFMDEKKKEDRLDYIDYQVGKQSGKHLMAQAVQKKHYSLVSWLHKETYVTLEASLHAYDNPKMLFFFHKKKMHIEQEVFAYACQKGCLETVLSMIQDHGPRYKKRTSCISGLFRAAEHGQLAVLMLIYKYTEPEPVIPKLDYREYSHERFIGIYAMHYGFDKVADWVWHSGTRWTQRAIDYVCHKKNDHDFCLTPATKAKLEAYLHRK